MRFPFRLQRARLQSRRKVKRSMRRVPSAASAPPLRRGFVSITSGLVLVQPPTPPLRRGLCFNHFGAPLRLTRLISLAPGGSADAPPVEPPTRYSARTASSDVRGLSLRLGGLMEPGGARAGLGYGWRAREPRGAPEMRADRVAGAAEPKAPALDCGGGGVGGRWGAGGGGGGRPAGRQQNRSE